MLFKGLIPVVMLLLGTCLHAQVYLGPKAGATASWQSDHDRFSRLKPGVEVGISSFWRLKGQNYLSVDLTFIEKGYKRRFDQNDLFDQLSNLYLQVPIIFGRKIPVGQSGKSLLVEAGGFYGRWLSGEFKSRISSDSEVIEESYEFTDTFDENGFRDNRHELGLIVGSGFMLPNNQNHMVISIRYYQGLSSIYKYQDDRISTKTANRNLTLSLIYLFNLKSKN